MPVTHLKSILLLKRNHPLHAQTKSIDWFPFDENNQLKWGKVRSVDIPYGQNIQVQWYANLNSWRLYESIR